MREDRNEFAARVLGHHTDIGNAQIVIGGLDVARDDIVELPCVEVDAVARESVFFITERDLAFEVGIGYGNPIDSQADVGEAELGFSLLCRHDPEIAVVDKKVRYRNDFLERPDRVVPRLVAGLFLVQRNLGRGEREAARRNPIRENHTQDFKIADLDFFHLGINPGLVGGVPKGSAWHNRGVGNVNIARKHRNINVLIGNRVRIALFVEELGQLGLHPDIDADTQ